jgi:hypothetical protein
MTLSDSDAESRFQVFWKKFNGAIDLGSLGA